MDGGDTDYYVSAEQVRHCIDGYISVNEYDAQGTPLLELQSMQIYYYI